MTERELRSVGYREPVRVRFYQRSAGYPSGWKPIVRVGILRFVNRRTAGVDLLENWGTRNFQVLPHKRFLGVAPGQGPR